MTTLHKAALAQEPVGYQYQDKDGNWHFFMNQKHYADTAKDGRWPIRAVYTAPQPKRLTDEQIEQCVQQAVAAKKLSWQGFKLDAQGLYTVPVMSQTHFQLARAIEAAVLGEKP